MLPDDPNKPDPNAPKPDDPDNGDGLAEVFREIESDEPKKKVDEPPA